jgi:hypothetical protein
MNLHKILIRLLKLLFGDFNGVQVFLYPMTLFYWIDTDSFLWASTGLFTSQKYFFPLVVFLLAFIYVAFLVVKNHSALYSDLRPHPAAEKRSFNLTVIGLHKLLLIILFAAGMIYLVAAFLNHFYGIALPLKVIYLVLARLVCVLLILGYAIRNSWTRPFRERGLDLTRALALVRREYHERQGRYLLHAVAYVLLAVIFSAFYNLIVLNVFYLLFSIVGVSPNLYLAVTNGFPALFYDILVICVAVMLSNLLFSPLVKRGVDLAERLHPRRFQTAEEAPVGEAD